jgi:hypothetical protein
MVQGPAQKCVRPARKCPTFEALEDRCVPSSLSSEGYFSLGRSSFALVARIADPDNDVNDDLYTATLTYSDGSTSGGTVTNDAQNPQLLDIYAGHTFKTPGTNRVQIRVDEFGNGEKPGEGFDTTASVVVPFPTFSEIVADPGVMAQTQAAWGETLLFSRGHRSLVREEGFYILLHTDTGEYEFTPTVYGHAFAPTAKGVGVTLPPPPADTPGNLYTVALFHTHVAVKDLSERLGQTVGPSTADNTTANRDQLPGLVFDYVATHELHRRGKIIPYVSGGTSFNAPAMIYPSGPDQRPTPP